jgi:hypothetical protein
MGSVVEERGGRRFTENLVGRNLGANAEVEPQQIVCVSSDSCEIAGFYVSSTLQKRPFVEGEIDGAWSPAQRVATNINSSESTLNSLSCTSRANCVAGGSFSSPTTGLLQAYTVDQVNGQWEPGVPVFDSKGSVVRSSSLQSIECVAVSHCVEVGSYGSENQLVFVRVEVSGRPRGTVHYFVGHGGGPAAIDCENQNHCLVVGSVEFHSSSSEWLRSRAFNLEYVDGRWRAIQVFSIGNNSDQWSGLTSVSCVMTSCFAAGFEMIKGQQQGVVVKILLPN